MVCTILSHGIDDAPVCSGTILGRKKVNHEPGTTNNAVQMAAYPQNIATKILDRFKRYPSCVGESAKPTARKVRAAFYREASSLVRESVANRRSMTSHAGAFRFG